MAAFNNLHPFVLNGVLVPMSWQAVSQQFLDGGPADIRGFWLDQSNQAGANVADGGPVQDTEDLAC